MWHLKKTPVKSILTILFLSAAVLSAHAQAIESPIQWSFRAESAGEGQYDLSFIADIAPGWYLYSQHLGDDGPIPTTISFNENGNYQLQGATEEAGEKVEGMDALFGMHIVKFKKQAIFTQRIKAGDELRMVSGYIEFMSCDEEKCLPPREIEFTFSFEE